jgi:hypothetical protein
MNTRKELGLKKKLGTVLNRGAQAHARNATQVFDRGGQAVARGSCLLQVNDRDAQAAARGADPFASHNRRRGAEAVARGTSRCTLHVLDRSAQVDARGAVPHVLGRGAEVGA